MLARVQGIFNALTMGGKGGFYAVRTGRKTGVFRTWYEFTLEGANFLQGLIC